MAIVLTLLSSCEKKASSAELLIIGHRGLATVHTENTVESFDELLKAKVYRVETDVLFTKWDTVMIFHDFEVSDITNLSGPLTDFTPTQIKAGMKAKSGGTALTLYEFLDQYIYRFEQVYLDLKDGQGDNVYRLVDTIIVEIQKRGIHPKVVLSSTREPVLEYIQKKDRNIQLATDFGTEGLKSAMRHGFQYCLIPLDDMSPSLYSFAQSGHVKLIGYTTTNIIDGERAIKNGCDGVLTDAPIEMNELYGK